MDIPLNALHMVAPLGGFVFNVAAQLLSVRLMKGLGILKSVYAGFLAGGLSVLLFELYLWGPRETRAESLSMICANLIIYGSLGYCYFHFINLGITARRIRILRELYASPGGLTLGELLQRYNAGHMITVRLERLLNSGQIVLRDNRYHIGRPVMLFMSKTIVAMKLLVLGKRSEFE